MISKRTIDDVLDELDASRKRIEAAKKIAMEYVCLVDHGNDMCGMYAEARERGENRQMALARCELANDLLRALLGYSQ
jgi:hypothetical protein